MEPKDYCSVRYNRDDRISPYKCRNRLTTWKDAINDLNAFIKPAQSSLQAQKKRTKVPRHGF